MDDLFYLCFSVNKLPDLTLTKYSVFDGSSVGNIMDKHGVFLRQLHRLGYTSGVYFHLLYYYNPDKKLQKGRHLSIIFYATARERSKLQGIREFLTNSVLSNYYDFFCYEIATDFSLKEVFSERETKKVLELTNVLGETKKYNLGKIEPEKIKEQINNHVISDSVFEISSDEDKIISVNKVPVDDVGRIICGKKFSNVAFLTKKDYFLTAQNRFNDKDTPGEVKLYSIMEWVPCKKGRLYNVLKLMEGYNQEAALRIDIFPVESTQDIRKNLPYDDIRKRISDRWQGKDDNSENILKSWDKYLNNLMKFPQFYANVVAFADSKDIAVMLADSVAAEAVESGTYLIETMESKELSDFSVYYSDAKVLHREVDNYIVPYLSLYTLEEIRPMFSFPILYPGESVECQKETDPKLHGDEEECILLGYSDKGYKVNFPIEEFKKHAFIAGVPGSGKTNTMLYLVTALWRRGTKKRIPFLVLEPAKQEYRALAMIEGMEDLCIFSPGADTKFPLHINPFEFPIGLTLAEHIANLNAVFAGAFELILPTPFLIDKSIEKIYVDKGWNVNERNNGTKEYPTMQEMYDYLKITVEESGYAGEQKDNIRSIMEVRIGSLLRREIGNVYNVRESSIKPEDWLEHPIIIELEALGEGPANFMSLLISTLIREVLKVKKTSELAKNNNEEKKVKHIIFYEEAHNLIGPTTENPAGNTVDPKISATKYLVKMLAEVRALGEGIVIADQLPTAMAPEVLKNTGLKLGHRITAQDDRNLLCSTMCASAEQLEEQGTFEKGQALIFYEGLLKPFKMQVCEWEKDSPQNKKDSLTDIQLFERIKDNKKYNELLSKSAELMQKKMTSEFKALCEQVEVLELKINRKNSEDKFSYAIIRDLKQICWEFTNLYLAYMTLSKNYYIYTNDMYMCTINNYMSLFDAIKFLHHNPQLEETVISETSSVMTDVGVYIDYMFEDSYVILRKHPLYNKILLRTGNYIINRIDVETEHIIKLVRNTKCSEVDGNSRILDFAKKFSNTYFTFLNIADKHYMLEEESSKEIYIALAEFVIKVFNNIKGLDEDNKHIVMINTVSMLNSFRKLVDYRDKNTQTVLSGWIKYPEIWKKTDKILQMEIYGKFEYLHRIRRDTFKSMENISDEERIAILSKTAIQYDGIFRLYSQTGTESFETELILINQYLRYVVVMIKLGPDTQKIMIKSLRINWRDCSNIMRNLMKENRVDESKKEDWRKLLDYMEHLLMY